MSVTFTKDATVVTVRSPLFPYRPEESLAQVKSYTEGGTLVVQDLGAGDAIILLSFRNLSTTERDNLYSFWKNTVDGASTTFTFTEPDASTFTARWMDDVFDFQMDTEGRWSGTITLRDES